MFNLEQFTFELIVNLIANVIQKGIDYSTLSYYQKRRIERRVEDATAEVVEPILPFLTQEKIPQDKQKRLIETCVEELRPFTENPAPLFQGSLDGQRIFEDLYKKRDIPQVVIEDELKEIYTLLCPRIATLLCKIPAAVKDWENEAWSENYRRLDELTSQLRQLFCKVDELATNSSRQSDETLSIVRRSLAQRIGLELDLTSLRPDRPLTGKFDDFFIHPEIKQLVEEEKQKSLVLNTPDDSCSQYLKKNTCSIIVGSAGAGKSTWSKWLQRETLTNRWTGICVRFELRRLANEPQKSINELIRETAGKHLAEDLTAERICKWLNDKKILFIFDGFDEIPPSERDNVYEWITELLTALRGCPIIISSRPLTTDHLDRLGNKWQRWEIEPFNNERIIEYIHRWYSFTPLLTDNDRKINAEELASTWINDPTIEPLTGNPLLLSTLLMVHHLDGSLPNGRSQLYRRYVEGMLGIWDDRRKVSATNILLSLEQKRQIIKGFAIELFFEELEQLDENDIINWLNEFLIKNKINISAIDILSNLRERSGLIIGPGIYSFTHKTIAEYFVAETILDGDQLDIDNKRIDRFLLFEHRDDDRWNTVTFLWGGLAPIADIELFIDECIRVKNWKLAFGLFDDQYNRFSLSIRRHFFQELLAINKTDKEMRSYFTLSQPKKSRIVRIQIPTCEIRRLGGRYGKNTYHLVSKGTSDGTIILSDINKASQIGKELLWFSFTRNVNNINDWKKILQYPCPLRYPKVYCYYLVIEYALCFEYSNTDFSFIDIFEETIPEYQGLIPVAMISSILQLIYNGKDKKHSRSATFLNKANTLLEILPNVAINQFPIVWLKETNDWVLGYEKDINVHIGDLFKYFIRKINQYTKKGVISKSNITNDAIIYVRELINTRDMKCGFKLLVQQDS